MEFRPGAQDEIDGQPVLRCRPRFGQAGGERTRRHRLHHRVVQRVKHHERRNDPRCFGGIEPARRQRGVDCPDQLALRARRRRAANAGTGGEHGARHDNPPGHRRPAPVCGARIRVVVQAHHLPGILDCFAGRPYRSGPGMSHANSCSKSDKPGKNTLARCAGRRTTRHLIIRKAPATRRAAHPHRSRPEGSRSPGAGFAKRAARRPADPGPPRSGSDGGCAGRHRRFAPATSPRRSSGFKFAVRVVRSIASSAATLPMVGGSGRFSDISSENWPLVRPSGRKASSNCRPTARDARCRCRHRQASRTILVAA